MKMYMKDTKKEVNAEVVCTFEDDSKRHFVILTDHSFNDKGEMNIYPYFFEKENEDILLSEIDSDDLYLVDEAFKKIREENNI
ncbi:MAG: DUF1292 domain-containing protein [Bacilli bacterium]|nr:DUF1292 domain-containing protein [Bacilli bacterium]